MRKGKGLWIVLGLVAVLPILGLANGTWVNAAMPTADSAIWLIDNTTGAPVTGLYIEFSQEVTIVGKVDVGGNLVAAGELTGTSFTFVGELCNLGTVIFEWQPIEAVPALRGSSPHARPILQRSTRRSSSSSPTTPSISLLCPSRSGCRLRTH